MFVLSALANPSLCVFLVAASPLLPPLPVLDLFGARLSSLSPPPSFFFLLTASNHNHLSLIWSLTLFLIAGKNITLLL